MKKWLPVFFTILFIFMSLAAQAKPPLSVKTTGGEARITALRGNAEAVCPEQSEVRRLKRNDLISVGCTVTTGEKSHLELLLPDQSIVRFSEKTQFKLINAKTSEDGKRSISISIGIGKIWMNIRKALLGADEKFEISCHNAVAGVRGTVYRMDVETDQSARVKVYQGEVKVSAAPKAEAATGSAIEAPKTIPGPTPVAGPKPVSMEEWVYIVKAMQRIDIRADGKAEPPRSFDDAEDLDEWVKWNKRRDLRNRY